MRRPARKDHAPGARQAVRRRQPVGLRQTRGLSALVNVEPPSALVLRRRIPVQTQVNQAKSC